MDHPESFNAWFDALYARHTAQLRFAEIRRALQALSTAYVAKRDQLATGAALDGAGKRAAFALFYTPLHALTIREICRMLQPPKAQRLWDLGCGAGAAAIGWSLADPAPCAITGMDTHPWALGEARWNFRQLGLRGQTVRHNIGRLPNTAKGDAMVLAYTLNEIPDGQRTALRHALCQAASHGCQVLVIEPIAKRITPWWSTWEAAVLASGGRSDTWRFRLDLPERLRLLDRAAHFDHRELTARSLYLPGD